MVARTAPAAAAAPRRRPGAGPPERDPQRGRHRGHGRGAAGVATASPRRRWRGWRALRDRLGDGLVAAVPGAVETGDRATTRVAGHLHLRVRRRGERGPGGPARRGRRGRVGRGRLLQRRRRGRAMCSPPWASSRGEAASGIRFSLGSTTTDDGDRPRPWPSCPGRSPSCETDAHARAGGHVRWCRLLGGGRPRWPSGSAATGGGGHPQAVGRRLGLGVLLGGRRRGRPPGGRPAGPGPPRLQLRRRLRGRRWSTPMSPATPRDAPPIPASSATGTSSSTGCSNGPGPSGSTRVATGHHARCVTTADGRFRLCRGADPAKDQSYVLAMLGQAQLARTLFPVGEMTKAEVRRRGPSARAAHRGQARQPGRLLHPVGRGPPGLPGRSAGPPPRPAGRPRHRRGPRCGGRPSSW